MKKRVIIIGLDGATFDLIEPWVKKGLLPHFATLLEQGAYGRLDSVPNMRSAAAWTSFSTGKNPGKHGIYEFYDFIPSRYEIEFINGGICAEPSLWQLLSDCGKKVIVINVPMTYPAQPVNGILIAGLDAPGPKSKGFCFPPEIITTLEKRFGEYILEPGLTGYIIGGNIKAGIEKLYRELKQKKEIACYFMDNYEWDFFMVVFRSLDAVQHCFWKYMDPTHPQHNPKEAALWGDTILNAYRKIDEAIGEIKKRLGTNDLLLIMSDHGFGQKHPASNQLNAWLASKGYLNYHTPSDFITFLKWLYRLMAGITPRKYKEMMAKILPDFRNRIHSRLCFTGINWQATKAYSDTLFPNIRINLKGREAEGIVEPGKEYYELIERIKEDLLNCRDAKTGERIVEEVLLRNEKYHGPYVFKAPDITIRWREDIQISGIKIEKMQLKNVPAYTPFIPAEDYRVISGDHRRYGVFIAFGQEVRQMKVEGVNIMDLAPTTLAFLDCPVLEDMDGRIIEDIFKHNLKVKQTSVSLPSHTNEKSDYSEKEVEDIKKRLRSLGYLE